jgi:hypothetical protein
VRWRTCSRRCSRATEAPRATPGAPCTRRAARERAHEDPERARDDRARLREIERLIGFDADLYGGPTLSQEQIAESLKRVRTMIPGGGFREALHATVPVAVAPRDVHVRAPEPIAVEAKGDESVVRGEILARLHERLQAAVDRLDAELAPIVDPHRRPNPLAR